MTLSFVIIVMLICTKRVKKIKEDYLENRHKVCTFVEKIKQDYVRETFWI